MQQDVGGETVDMVEFGARLQELRLRAGYTQSDLAQRLGIKQPNYWQIETGKKLVRGDTIYKICRALGCSADYLLGLTGEADAAGVPPGHRRQAASGASAGG